MHRVQGRFRWWKTTPRGVARRRGLAESDGETDSGNTARTGLVADSGWLLGHDASMSEGEAICLCSSAPSVGGLVGQRGH